jgi:membrane protein
MSSTPTIAEARRWALGWAGWRHVIARTAAAYKADEVSNLAAVVTLRIVLAVVPSLIAGVAVAAQVVSTADIERLVGSAGGMIPGSARDFVERSLQTAIENLQQQGSLALVASTLIGLVAASGAATAMVEALNRAYGVKEGRGFVGQRLVSLGVVLALAVALAGLFVAVVLGPVVLRWLLPQEVLESPLAPLITLGRVAAAIVVLILFFGFTFWYGPDRHRPRLRFLTPGAVLGVAGWLLLSWLFGIYVAVAGRYSATYGAFAGVIVLLVWLHYSFTVLLMGAELDHEIDVHLGAALADAEVIDPSVALSADRAG